MGAAMCALASVPGVLLVEGPSRAMIDVAGRCPEIISFAIANPLGNDAWLSAGRLRRFHGALADRGVLLGQPVDVGPFGVLRLAFGMRDRVGDGWMHDLERTAGELGELLSDVRHLSELRARATARAVRSQPVSAIAADRANA
jgi:hypothetical protein